ncbi:hypothetical protein CAEBREN_15685 [Caenorhabditis brenneri]|uniref:Uncharacterized protein n=1 Tax=Caenorhabditis brenneri TaxID=135651 RepID=G0P1X7_CAEBE|nr:hypothetical protein CAEBREN_15685 [Caenorhabditis brenneri]
MLPSIIPIILLPVLQGCLVVQTPKCECPILALSSPNIAQHVGDHAFYKNVSGYPMATPVVKSEDCSVSMYCEGDYSLVVFDKETATMLHVIALFEKSVITLLPKKSSLITIAGTDTRSSIFLSPFGTQRQGCALQTSIAKKVVMGK